MLEPKNYARYGAARDAILNMLHSGKFVHTSTENKLPSEGELSRRIGVSTGTIREALRILEMEGIITKKHGSGNFYHRSALNLKMRIDLISDYRELLAQSGYDVMIERWGHCFREPAERESKVFNIHEEIMSYEQVYLADGKNAIFTRNIVPRKFLTDDLESCKEEINLMELLWNHCQERIANSIEDIFPRRATRSEAELFGISEDLPIIAIDQIFYSYKDTPIGYAVVSFNPDIVKMHMLRKWS